MSHGRVRGGPYDSLQHKIHADDYDEDGDGQSREVKQPSGNLPRLHRSVLPSSRMQIVDMAIPTAGVTLTVGVQDPKHAQYASDDDGHKCEDLEEFEEPFFECKPPIGYEFEEPFAQGLPHLFEGNKSTLFSRSEEPYDSHMTHSYRLTEGRLIRYPSARGESHGDPTILLLLHKHSFSVKSHVLLNVFVVFSEPRKGLDSRS